MEWISINDRLPNCGIDVLVTDGTAQMVACLRYDKTFDFYYNKVFWKHDEVTHWQTLPDPPKK